MYPPATIVATLPPPSPTAKMPSTPDTPSTLRHVTKTMEENITFADHVTTHNGVGDESASRRNAYLSSPSSLPSSPLSSPLPSSTSDHSAGTSISPSVIKIRFVRPKEGSRSIVLSQDQDSKYARLTTYNEGEIEAARSLAMIEAEGAVGDADILMATVSKDMASGGMTGHPSPSTPTEDRRTPVLEAAVAMLERPAVPTEEMVADSIPTPRDSNQGSESPNSMGGTETIGTIVSPIISAQDPVEQPITPHKRSTKRRRSTVRPTVPRKRRRKSVTNVRPTSVEIVPDSNGEGSVSTSSSGGGQDVDGTIGKSARRKGKAKETSNGSHIQPTITPLRRSLRRDGRVGSQLGFVDALFELDDRFDGQLPPTMPTMDVAIRTLLFDQFINDLPVRAKLNRDPTEDDEETKLDMMKSMLMPLHRPPPEILKLGLPPKLVYGRWVRFCTDNSG